MFFNLFDEPATTDAVPLLLQISQLGEIKQSEPLLSSSMPTPVKATSLVEDVSTRYQRGLDASITNTTQIRSLLHADYGEGFDPLEDVRQKLPCASELNKTIFGTIIRNARKTGLAAPGNYVLDPSDEIFYPFLTGLPSRRGIDSKDKVEVNILGLCNAIFKLYGGDAGRLIENQRIAVELIRAFDLRKQEINVKAGVVELKRYCYLEKNYSGGYNFSHSTIVDIQHALGLLSHVFEVNGLNMQMTDLKFAIHDYSFRPEPNKTTFTGQIGEFPMIVKIFKQEVRWRFTEQCIAIISDFVSEYGCPE